MKNVSGEECEAVEGRSGTSTGRLAPSSKKKKHSPQRHGDTEKSETELV